MGISKKIKSKNMIGRKNHTSAGVIIPEKIQYTIVSFIIDLRTASKERLQTYLQTPFADIFFNSMFWNFRAIEFDKVGSI